MNFEFVEKMSLEAFKEMKGYILIIFPVLFALRLVALNFMGSSSRDYGELIKNTLLFLALISSFEYFLSLSFDFSQSLRGSDMIHASREAILPSSTEPPIGLSIVRKTLGLLSSIIYYLAQCLFLVALIFLSALAPLVFLFGSLLAMPSLIKIFYFILLVGSSWPLLFAVFDRVGFVLLKNGLDKEGLLFGWAVDFLIELFKLLGPLAFIKLLLGTSFGRATVGLFSKGGSVASAAIAVATPKVLEDQFQRPNSRESRLRIPSRFNEQNELDEKKRIRYAKQREKESQYAWTMRRYPSSSSNTKTPSSESGTHSLGANDLSHEVSPEIRTQESPKPPSPKQETPSKENSKVLEHKPPSHHNVKNAEPTGVAKSPPQAQASTSTINSQPSPTHLENKIQASTIQPKAPLPMTPPDQTKPQQTQNSPTIKQNSSVNHPKQTLKDSPLWRL